MTTVLMSACVSRAVGEDAERVRERELLRRRVEGARGRQPRARRRVADLADDGGALLRAAARGRLDEGVDLRDGLPAAAASGSLRSRAGARPARRRVRARRDERLLRDLVRGGDADLLADDGAHADIDVDVLDVLVDVVVGEARQRGVVGEDLDLGLVGAGGARGRCRRCGGLRAHRACAAPG